MSDSTAIYPGSFDPITNGHLDIIERSGRIFNKVIVAVLCNPQKDPLFDVETRVDLIKNAREWKEDKIEVESFEGLLVDFARQSGSEVIVRGLREIADFEYEFQMALMNKRLNANVETLFMMPKEEYTYVSSKLIKEVVSLGGDVNGLVPPNVEEALKGEFSDGVF